MPQRFYTAVLEHGDGDAVGLWFADFPGCVVAGRSQEEAMQRASEALGEAMAAFAEHNEGALPASSSIQSIVIPAGCRFIAFVAVGATPPNPSERVNIYLPKRLIERVDHEAAERGMSRSSFFGMAVSHVLMTTSPRPRDEPDWLVRHALATSRNLRGR